MREVSNTGKVWDVGWEVCLLVQTRHPGPRSLRVDQACGYSQGDGVNCGWASLIGSTGLRILFVQGSVLVWADQLMTPCNPNIEAGAWLSTRATYKCAGHHLTCYAHMLTEMFLNGLHRQHSKKVTTKTHSTLRFWIHFLLYNKDTKR